MQGISKKELSIKIDRLRALVFQFDKLFDEEKSQLLAELSSINSFNYQKFKQYHQLLLTMMAYPNNLKMLGIINNSMQKLLLQLAQKPTLQKKLSGTGLLNTLIECNFSFEKINYITQQYPNQIYIHSAASKIETQKLVLKLLLPSVEYSKIHEGEKDLKYRISKFNISKTITDLEWLLQLMNQSTLDLKTKAVLYNQLDIYITWKVSDSSKSVSYLKGTTFPIYFHKKPLNKKVNLYDIIQQKLPAKAILNKIENKQILDAAKLTLFYLYRETEPFTNGNDDDITLFKLDQGISIALFGSINSKRYSLESYIGYMVFKNNMPAAYGGGWIFGERCQFGINILEAFRGGESSLIISELLRVYHQYYKVNRFVVKPYQFGFHNAEAIKTGAFWFYYKLGFKPENEELKELALKEEKQKIINPKFKSETATLKKYTKSNLSLTLIETSYPNYDAEILSQKITNYVNETFNGDRQKALTVCFENLKTNTAINTSNWEPELINYAKQIAVLFNINSNSKAWQQNNKKNIELFITLKFAKTELPWIQHLQKFKAFWKYMEA